MPRAGKVPLTPGLHKQTLTFGGQVLAQLPMISEAKQQYYLAKPERLKRVLLIAFANDLEPSVTPDLLRWRATYEKLFGKKLDFSGIRIPDKPEGVGPVRLIVVARELIEWTDNHPLEVVQEALKKHFPGLEYANDLDQAISTNDRDPKNGSYAVWIEDGQESYEHYANKSADDLKAEGHVGPTVLECQLHEFDHFVETSNHLDVENVRLCTGSRRRGGRVPSAYWGVAGFSISWYRSSGRLPNLRSRRVWA